MAKIIGIRPSEFKGDDGSLVKGLNIYLTEPLEHGEGYSADRVYVTDAKRIAWGYQPKVGDEVVVSYNRFGKCCGMDKVQPK